jgi:two-component system chemotaxis response regulator CheY
MIVDDSAMVRRQVRLALEGAGFVVVEAVDGEDARDKLAAHATTRLVVCDVNMPKMNGLELLERMRADGRMDAVPIVMLTTEGQPELIHRANSLGAKGWLVKPFKPDTLVAVVRKLAR